MKRYLIWIGAVGLAVSSSLGAVSAQDSEPVDADGGYVVSNDTGAPNASGAGTDYVYGDINTGGAGGEVLGDPSAVYAPVLPDHPGPGGGLLVMPGSGDGMIGGVPIQPVPAAPDATTNTTTNLATTDGSTTENIPVEALVPEESAPVPVTEETAATGSGFCSQYGTWYDAQVAYENLGATAADPALVAEVDADYDGIACEGFMA
jgi:hypothetical protein